MPTYIEFDDLPLERLRLFDYGEVKVALSSTTEVVLSSGLAAFKLSVKDHDFNLLVQYKGAWYKADDVFVLSKMHSGGYSVLLKCHDDNSFLHLITEHRDAVPTFTWQFLRKEN
jgi:hypothetical protein